MLSCHDHSFVTIWLSFTYPKFVARPVLIVSMDIASNIFDFGGHKQPIYEVVGLNYSVFSYLSLAEKLAEI